MEDIVKQILARPIQLADQVIKLSDDVHISYKANCSDLKANTDKLATLLRQAARASNNLYERPTRRIIDDTEQVLDKALSLVIKCRGSSLLKRVFTIIPATAFCKTLNQLENSIGNVSWLLRVSASAGDRDDEYLGLPPIASNEPILCLIWEQVAILHTGSLEDCSVAAASLVSLARDNDRYGRLIIEEGGVPALLKLAKEGRTEGQENAARAIGLLGRDPKSVTDIVNAGVCSVFAKLLKDGHMKVQVVVAWAVSELAANHPKCQDHFAQNNVIRLLVSHLAFETVQEHSKYAIVSKQKMSIHLVGMDSNTSGPGGGTGEYEEKQAASQILHLMGNENRSQMHNVVADTMAMKDQTPLSSNTPPLQSHSSSNHQANKETMCQNSAKHHQHQQHHNHHPHVSLAGSSIKGREFDDPATKAQMKAMAARALWQLSKGNVSVCQSITESRALLSFAILLEKGPKDVQHYSAMALMEIAAVAEENAELRRSAFKPTSPAARAVVDQLLRIIEKGESELLVSCIKSIGSLARTFRATETRMISPLVKLLDEREAEISREATIALHKFACTENFLHVSHCKAIIGGGGVKHLIQLVYFGEQMVQVPAVMLLCDVTMHVPDSYTLAQEEVIIVLEWSTKQAHLNKEAEIRELILEAKSRLELYQARGSRALPLISTCLIKL